MYKARPVPMPSEKITLKNNGHGIYVYKIIKSWVDENGKHQNESKIIGRKDPDTGLLIPNKRYKELYPDLIDKSETLPDSNSNNLTNLNSPISQWCVKSIGNIRLFTIIAHRCGLIDILQKVFPDTWHEILYIAIYMLCNGNNISGINEWSDEVSELDLYAQDPYFQIDDRYCSQLFENISISDECNFFYKWISIYNDNNVECDVATIQTNNHNMNKTVSRKNTCNESIKQVNMAVVFGCGNKLPLIYTALQGNIPNETSLIEIIDFMKEFNFKNITFILEQGFETEENLVYLKQNKCKFLVPFPDTKVIDQSLIEKNLHYVKRFKNYISGYGIYGLAIKTNIFGMAFNAHLYYDHAKANADDLDLKANIIKLEDELGKDADIKIMKKIPKKYAKFFKLVVNNNGQKEIARDYDKIDEIILKNGYFIILTPDLNLTSQEVLAFYKKREMFEKHFFGIDSGVGIDIMETGNNKNSRGKFFVSFIALILRAYLLREINLCNDQTFAHISLAEIIRKMASIKLEQTNRKITIHGIKKEQNTIISNLQIPIEYFSMNLGNILKHLGIEQPIVKRKN